MTQRTKTALQTNLNADLADNTTGDISAADVRNNLIDFTDSVPFLSSATNVVSGSFSGSFQGDGSGLTGISGGSTDTGSLLTTASVSLNTITFTKGDASTFNITVDTGSAGGSTFPYTGSAGITGSLDVVGDFTVDKSSGEAYDYTTGSILVANLELLGNESALMRGRVNTEIRGESFYDANPSLPGNITITNTLGFGSTKGYTKIDAGNVIISGSAVYIKTNALPTSEPSDSGQLWLSGSAGNSKYLMVRD